MGQVSNDRFFDIVQEGEKNQCGNISPIIKNRFHKLWQSKAICISGNTHDCDLFNWYILPHPSLNCIESIPSFRVFCGENCYEYNLIKCNRWGIPLNLIYKYRYTLFLRKKKKFSSTFWCRKMNRIFSGMHSILFLQQLEDRGKSWTGIYQSSVYSFKKK